MKTKVNVWQVGFTNMKDYMLKKSEGLAYKKRGYVMVEVTKGWEEDVWDLLNWSCWTSKKPEDVYSSLDHCNSDIVLQIEGTTQYKCAMSVGFKNCNSFEDAVATLKNHIYNLWPLEEVHRDYVAYKSDGKDVWGSNNNKDWFII